MKKSHSTGNVRLRTNAYGKRKVSVITTRGKTTKKHTMMSASTSFAGRKGMKNKTKGYEKHRYVGRKTKRKV